MDGRNRQISVSQEPFDETCRLQSYAVEDVSIFSSQIHWKVYFPLNANPLNALYTLWIHVFEQFQTY